MARKQSPTLTDGEARIMDVAWERGAVSVRDVTDVLSAREKVAYTSVQTLMGILEQKGYLSRRREGRAFVYEPRVSREDAQGEAVHHLLGKFFDGSKRELLHNLLGDSNLSQEEARELRALLNRRVRASKDEP